MNKYYLKSDCLETTVSLNKPHDQRFIHIRGTNNTEKVL